MKNRKKWISMILCLVLMLTMIPVTQTGAATVALNHTKLTISLGETRTLIVTGTKKKITWSSSDKAIATVSADGVVTAVKKGKATITAKYSNKKLNCKVTVRKIDPEVQRGVTLGLVKSSYLKTPAKAATTQELEDILTTILKKRGASAKKIKEWQKLANGTKDTAINWDVAIGAYHAAVLLAKDGVPKTNGSAHAYMMFGEDWSQIEFGNPAIYEFIRPQEGPWSLYNSCDGFFDPDNGLQTYDWSNVAAEIFSHQLASHYSGQLMIPLDYDSGTMRSNKKLTRAELVLRMVRFYDSFEEKAQYLSIDKVGAQTVITEAEIQKAAAVPEVTESGYSGEWIGANINKYVEVGADGGLAYPTPTWNYREAEFAVAKDVGINHARLQFAINSFAYPDYSKDRSKINRQIVEEWDNVIRWGLKYGIHIRICFQGYLDDDLDGLGAMGPDGVKENEFTFDCHASEEQYKLKARLIEAFAKRYRNVPAKYLSFELQNENQTGHSDIVIEGVRSLSDDEMADQFIMLANAAWSVTPERGIFLSTDEFLNEKNLPYWSKIAAAGINLDWHAYEPRSFVSPDAGRMVDVSDMVWPHFVDENGIEWDMDKVYSTYMEPWKNLADQYSVGFQSGECILCVADMSLYDTPPRVQKYVVAWAKDYSTMMQKHHISYTVNGIVENFSAVWDYLPEETNMHGYIRNAKYTLKTYYLDNYSCTFYVNEEYAKACYGKK